MNPVPNNNTPNLSGLDNHVINQVLKKSNSFLIHGITASVLLTVVYFIIVTIAESFDHAATQLISLAYLFIPLIVSFGVQIALFSYARQQSKLVHQGSANVTGSGGMSGVSMILCCAHHLTDVAAFVGLAAVSVFLTTFQPVFLLIGVISNITGILTVLIFLQKNVLYYRKGLLSPFMRLNLPKVRKLAIITGVVVLIVAFALVALSSQGYFGSNNEGKFVLSSKTVVQNGLTIQATPQPFKYGEPIKISLAMDTHAGDLSYNLSQVTTLQDSNGTTYMPLSWSGPTTGGHHVSGTLSFPPLNGQPSSIRLIIKDVYGSDWTFEWTLNG
jgi:hypothetical protein